MSKQATRTVYECKQSFLTATQRHSGFSQQSSHFRVTVTFGAQAGERRLAPMLVGKFDDQNNLCDRIPYSRRTYSFQIKKRLSGGALLPLGCRLGGFPAWAADIGCSFLMSKVWQVGLDKGCPSEGRDIPGAMVGLSRWDITGVTNNGNV